MPHPLADDLAAVSGATGWLRLVTSPDAAPGWTACSALLSDPSSLDAWVQQTAAALARAEGSLPPPATPATYVMGWYLQVPATVAAWLFTTVRRVPDVSPASLVVHRAPFGYVDAVAVTGAGFTCLAGDVAASHPAATVVDDDTALAGALRNAVVGHARAFHDAFAPSVRIGSRQRWGMVHDVLDVALWQAGRSVGGDAVGVREARLVLDGAHPPLPEASRLRRVRDATGRPTAAWDRRRISCCFMFALPSGDVCASCPRRSGDRPRHR